MTTPIAFHFLLLSVGEVLKLEKTVTPQKMQDFIVRDDCFGGIRVPMNDLRLALRLMADSGFIEVINGDEYTRKYYPPLSLYPPQNEKCLEANLIPDYGDLMDLNKFVEDCEDGLLIDRDGSGFYADDIFYWRQKPAVPSDICEGKINRKFKNVVWFNK